jgi:hypothetical protein
MGKPGKESKKDKKDKSKDKESKKEKKEVKADAGEEKEFDYDALLKRCTVISKPMASEKLTKKVLKTTKKGTCAR